LEEIRVGDPPPGDKSYLPFEVRMGKVFGDPMNVMIVAEAGGRDVSPKQFHEKFGGGSLSRVSRHFDTLVEYGWLYLVETKTGGSRRGATEHFYRATEPAVFYNDAWARMPDSVKGSFSGWALNAFVAYIRRAMEVGTFDAREDRHFTNTALYLDQRGWERVVAKGDAFFHFLFKEQARARARLEKSGEKPISVTVGIAVYESPEGGTNFVGDNPADKLV
jgi:hypothetical protein